MAFPVTGRSHGLALGAKKVARNADPPGPGPAPVQVQRHFLCPKRQATGTPSDWERHSIKWERPVNGNAITLNGNAGMGWGGVGLGGLPTNVGQLIFDA